MYSELNLRLNAGDKVITSATNRLQENQEVVASEVANPIKKSEMWGLNVAATLYAMPHIIAYAMIRKNPIINDFILENNR